MYISADYDCEDGDSNVAEILNKWGSDNKHIVDFVDMAKVFSRFMLCSICIYWFYVHDNTWKYIGSNI